MYLPEFFDSGIEKLFSQALRFHPCALTSIDYLLLLLKITGYQECYLVFNQLDTLLKAALSLTLTSLGFFNIK